MRINLRAVEEELEMYVKDTSGLGLDLSTEAGRNIDEAVEAFSYFDDGTAFPALSDEEFEDVTRRVTNEHGHTDVERLNSDGTWSIVCSECQAHKPTNRGGGTACVSCHSDFLDACRTDSFRDDYAGDASEPVERDSDHAHDMYGD